MESLLALHDCMKELGLDRNDQLQYVVEAKINNLLEPSKFGMIDVTFNCNPHSSFGPDIELDEVIRGFGIHFVQFKPNYQEFTYDRKENELTIRGDNYHFSLGF